MLVGLNLLVKPFYLLVVEAEIQNRVGAESFGSYFALLNFSFILNILLDLGTTNWNTRHTAQNEVVRSHHLSGLIALRLLLALAYFVLCVIIGWMLDYSAWQMWLLAVLAFNQVLASGVLFFRSYLTGLHLFRHDSIISVLDRLLLLVSMSLLLWGGITGTQPFQLEWLVYGQTAAYFITLVVAAAMVLRHSERLQWRWNGKLIRGILYQSAPFTIMSFLSMVAYRIDGVMLERLDSPVEAGIYAMCYRIFEAVNMIAYLFAVLLLPMFARMLKRNEPIANLLQLSFKVMFAGVFTIGCTAFFFGETLLGFIYDHHLQEATPVFGWLMASVICFSLQYIFGTLITAAGDLRPMIYMALGAMIYNILLNTFYIPQFGALGAARASFFTQFMVLLAQIMVVRDRFSIGNFKSTLLRAVLFATASLAVGFIFSTPTISRLPVAYNIGFFAVCCVLLMAITKILDWKGFIQLMKSRD